MWRSAWTTCVSCLSCRLNTFSFNLFSVNCRLNIFSFNVVGCVSCLSCRLSLSHLGLMPGYDVWGVPVVQPRKLGIDAIC